MRRIVGTLLILYRHLHWLATAKTCPPAQEMELNRHHHEASMSDFYLWHMHFQLPLAAKLNYRHDFPGMYNHVTQPVYFHNPDYQRTKRAALEDPDAPAIHVLPSLCQLHPEIPVRFEEETRDDAWHWLIVSGRVYLAGPQGVYFSRDARSMLGVYLRAKMLEKPAPRK